jgi:hypothetical protein
MNECGRLIREYTYYSLLYYNTNVNVTIYLLYNNTNMNVVDLL